MHMTIYLKKKKKTSGYRDTQISFLRFTLWQYEYFYCSCQQLLLSVLRVMTVEWTGRPMITWMTQFVYFY